MYSRKSVGPRKTLEKLQHSLDILVKIYHPEPLEAIYYCEKKKQGQISDLKVCEENQHAKPKPLDILSATAWVTPDLLKAPAILSDTTVRRSAVDPEDLKPYWKSEKGHISPGHQQSYYLQVFERLY